MTITGEAPLIVGAAMTAFGPQPDETVRSLAEQASADALADAGLRADDVDLVVFANATGGLYDGQEMVRGQVALRHSGLLGKPVINVENACASSASALHVALMGVASGMARTVLVVGAEKLAQPAKVRTFAMLGGAVDLAEHTDVRRLLEAKVLGGLMDPAEAEALATDQSPFMEMYAARTRRYLARSGATDADVAAVSVKNRHHASLNPKAQFRTPVTAEQVLGSRMIAEPLRLLMCSPIADGAAALVVTDAGSATRLDRPAVRVVASEVRSGGPDNGPSAVERAASAAYERSGIDAADLDVIEIHDAAASAELWCAEELGLCDDGAAWHRAGHTRLGGRQPMNTSGGLLAKGHPVGATGCAQVVALVDQLRGRCGARQVEGARLGLAENGGGIIDGREAAAVIT
ncbi:MAG: thiolase family protein, partial [Actinomycetota bacterium]|nr:thiolase family protein [Actinomycetota bacterium]